MKFKLKLYFSLALTFFILINFGQTNVLANESSRSSGTKAEVDTIIVTSPGVDVRLVPNEFILHQNYPNPFNPSTTIQYEFPNVQLKIYDVPEKEVRELVIENQQSGKDNSGSVVSSGVYFYQLLAREFLQTKKLMLLK
jgi:hypothetical protein